MGTLVESKNNMMDSRIRLGLISDDDEYSCLSNVVDVELLVMFTASWLMGISPALSDRPPPSPPRPTLLRLFISSSSSSITDGLADKILDYIYIYIFIVSNGTPYNILFIGDWDPLNTRLSPPVGMLARPIDQLRPISARRSLLLLGIHALASGPPQPRGTARLRPLSTCAESCNVNACCDAELGVRPCYSVPCTPIDALHPGSPPLLASLGVSPHAHRPQLVRLCCT